MFGDKEKILENQKRLDNVEQIQNIKHQEYDEKILENQKRLDNVEQMQTAKHQEYDEKILESQKRLDNVEQMQTAKHQEYDEKILECQKRLDNVEQMQTAKHQEYDEKILECQTRLDNIEQFARHMRVDVDKIISVLLSNNSQSENIQDELCFNMLNKKTYSQSGEDAIIAYVLANMGIPFNKASYLDLGANFPVEGNNSYFLYKQGARGVLVEANPGLIEDLEKNRKEDVVLNRCIALSSGEKIKFHVMSDAGLSTPDMEQVKEVQSINPNVQLLYSKDVETITVNELFERYFNETPMICSIDIEGKDFEILNSIDMEKYRPLLYIVETIEYSTRLQVNAKRMDIVELMKENGYEEYAFTGVNSIFIDKKQVR